MPAVKSVMSPILVWATSDRSRAVICVAPSFPSMMLPVVASNATSPVAAVIAWLRVRSPVAVITALPVTLMLPFNVMSLTE